MKVAKSIDFLFTFYVKIEKNKKMVYIFTFYIKIKKNLKSSLYIYILNLFINNMYRTIDFDNVAGENTVELNPDHNS